jgi:hypothetical protein
MTAIPARQPAGSQAELEWIEIVAQAPRLADAMGCPSSPSLYVRVLQPRRHGPPVARGTSSGLNRWSGGEAPVVHEGATRAR